MLPRLAYFQSSSSGQNNIITSEVAKKSSIMSEFYLNLQKHVNVCCCSFNKISKKRKQTVPQEILTNDKFWPHDKFWRFWPNSFGVAHGTNTIVKFCFREFQKL